MAVKWIKTKYPGVRYREHAIRKHGGNRPDKCFSIRYKRDRKDVEEVIGWSSEGVTAESAFKLLVQIRENARLGVGAASIRELKTLNQQQKMDQIEAEAKRNKQAITFSQFWHESYLPHNLENKSDGSVRTELGLFQNWIEPYVGGLPISKLSVAVIEKLIAEARKKQKSPATIRYILAVISQMWSRAKLAEIVSGDCPCRMVKKPRQDNRRCRFLTKEEAKKLLDELALRSRDTHDIALISLHTGMRAGEICNLQWGEVNFVDDTIAVMDPKNRLNRHVFMTKQVHNMLNTRYKDQSKCDLVFPNRLGNKRSEISATFERAVDELGLNNSGKFTENEAGEKIAVRISDRRQKVVFHTLRHTFASWLVQHGKALYTVAELMGHTSIEMTRRYSHLAPDSLRTTAMAIEEITDPEPDGVAENDIVDS